MAAAQQPDAPAPAAAAPPAAAAAAPGDGAKKNRIKKLKAQYTAILELQQRADAGQVLDAGQAEKVARKAAVADELASMGAELPDPPPLPAAADDGVSAAEMQAALDALMLGGGAVPPRKAPPGANPMLRRQFQLLAENPQSDYFLTMPEPFPDMGVALSDGMGKAFMMTMRPRAEAGQPRAVKMIYQLVNQTAEEYGFPSLQVRQQLIHEYAVDPVTEQAVPGSADDQLEWLLKNTTAGERAAAERQMERLVKNMAQGGAGSRRAGAGQRQRGMPGRRQR